MSSAESSLDLFLSGFAARDIAEPLASFDETTPLPTIRAAMEGQQLQVAAVRRGGFISGWLTLDDVAGEQQPPAFRPLEPSLVVGDTASLSEVVRRLDGAPCLFVRSLGQVAGFIGKSALENPAMRMWLFGLVTITESRVTRMIEEFCPDESWRQYLSKGRLKLAIELQEQRRRRHQNPSLLECLKFADKGRIVARDERLLAHTRFASQSAVDLFVRAFQDLRNNLAHSHDLAGDWQLILFLATNLQRVVLGPSVVSDGQPQNPRTSIRETNGEPI